MLHAILAFLVRCCRARADDVDAASADGDPAVLVHVTAAEGHGTTTKGSGDKPCIPAVFAKKYGRVVPGDVEAKEAVCVKQDVAVLGDATVAGDSCITGNLLIAGSVTARGSICVTGNVIVLANAHLAGHVCVTGDAFVQGDLAVKGKLDVGGKLCVFGSKDIQPDA